MKNSYFSETENTNKPLSDTNVRERFIANKLLLLASQNDLEGFRAQIIKVPSSALCNLFVLEDQKTNVVSELFKNKKDAFLRSVFENHFREGAGEFLFSPCKKSQNPRQSALDCVYYTLYTPEHSKISKEKTEFDFGNDQMFLAYKIMRQSVVSGDEILGSPTQKIAQIPAPDGSFPSPIGETSTDYSPLFRPLVQQFDLLESTRIARQDISDNIKISNEKETPKPPKVI